MEDIPGPKNDVHKLFWVSIGFALQIHTIWCIILPFIFKIKKVRFVIHEEHFLILEDKPDSWDGDQEPQVVPMPSTWPYFSFRKGLGFIPSFSSEI